MSAIPEVTKRGSFNAANTSLQQISGGIASIIAGIVVAQGPEGGLQRFDLLGYIVVATTLLSLGLMYFIQRNVAEISDHDNLRSQPSSAHMTSREAGSGKTNTSPPSRWHVVAGPRAGTPINCEPQPDIPFGRFAANPAQPSRSAPPA
jgi:hypothetical protein